MTPRIPHVAIAGDRLGVMARNGVLVGLSPALAVWRFGFRPDSPEAEVFHLVAVMPLWVLANHVGRVVMTRMIGWGDEPPLRFRHAIEARL